MKILETLKLDHGRATRQRRTFRELTQCKRRHNEKIKVKSRTCYSVSYTRQTRDQERFTISEAAAGWNQLMIPQRTMQPSIVCVSEQLNQRSCMQAYHRPNQATLMGLHSAARKLLLISHPAEGRRLSSHLSSLQTIRTSCQQYAYYSQRVVAQFDGALD